MMKLVAVVALALTFEGAFILHAVVATPGSAGAPTVLVRMGELRVAR